MENNVADFFSRIIDPDDLDELWGPFTIDRFASHSNTKMERFNSKFTVPSTEAVDAFTQDWRFENNLLVPPTNCLIRTINYLKTANIHGTLVVPNWPAALFWSCLRENGSFAQFITDWIFFSKHKRIFKARRF